MASKQIALEVAAFLDSAQARGLVGIERGALRALTEDLVSACYEDLAKEPRLLDGHDVRELLGRSLPARLAPDDPRAQHVPALFEAWLEHLEATQVVTQSYEIHSALEDALRAFRAAVASGELAGRAPAAPAAPFVHGASKLGRNDPCSCGSGKKYKKCHGRDA